MPTRYTVRPGDCVSSLADGFGLPWNQIWNHPENAELKNLRKDPNVLFTGDEIYIPDLKMRNETAAMDAQHKYVRNAATVTLRLKISASQIKNPASSDEAPTVEVAQCAGLPYQLDIEGTLSSGKTDGSGQIEVEISPSAMTGTLTLEPGTPSQTVIALKLGQLEPASELQGVRQRLSNLGYDPGDDSSASAPSLASAVRLFQQDNQLAATGQIDDALRGQLQKLHGS